MFSFASKTQHRVVVELYSWCAPSRVGKLCRTSVINRLSRQAQHGRFIHQQTPTRGQYKLPNPQNRMLWDVSHQDPQKWDKPTRRMVEERALVEARDGRTAMLSACLAFYLQQREYKAIIELYDHYATECEAAQPLPQQGAIGSDEVENRTRALLCAITAHAIEGSFEALLQAYTKTGMLEITHNSRNEHLWLLNPEKSTETQIMSYITDLTSAFFVLNPGSLRSYIKSLSKSASSRSLTRLYEGILNGITRPNPFIAACTSHHSTLPLVMSEATWASFIAAFVLCQRQDLAENLLDDLKVLKVKKGTVIWTSLLDAFDRLRLSGPALVAWGEMSSDGVQRDALAYRSIISVLFKDKQPRSALKIFAEFQRDEKKFEPLQTVAVYNTVVNGLLRSKLLPQAEQFLQMMKDQGHAPDAVTYNTFLDYYGRHQDFNGLLDVVTKMDEAGVKGDVYTFSTILNALLKAGRKDAMDIVLACMKEQGVSANAVIYSTLIDYQLGMGDEAHLRAALALLTGMEGNERIAPNNVTYTSFLTHLHRGNWMSPEKQESYRGEVLNRMKRRGIRLTLPDYHILLNACWSDRSRNAVTSAIEYYEDIKQRKIPMVNTTFYIMLAGLIERDESEMAKAVVRDIEVSDIEPSPSLSSLMRKVKEGSYVSRR